MKPYVNIFIKHSAVKTTIVTVSIQKMIAFSVDLGSKVGLSKASITDETRMHATIS